MYPTLVKGDAIDTGKQLAPLVLDGVIGSEHDQADRGAAGDTTIDVIGQMLDQLRFGQIIVGLIITRYCFAGWLAHNSLLARWKARLPYH